MITQTLYRELLPRSISRPPFELDSKPKFQLLSDLVRYHLNIKTWLALGATLQACLTLLPIPARYTLAPCFLYLLSRITLTWLVNCNILANPCLRGVIPSKYTAIVPDEYGNFPAEDEAPASNKVAVLLLNCKFNHPAGMAAPHAMALAQHFIEMNKELGKIQQAESGCLGQCQAYMPSAEGAIQLMNISYWRSKEHIVRYAEGPAHRAAMKWWADLGGFEKDLGKIPHLGISHEIFESEAGCWENMYRNTQPTLLGATSFMKKGDIDEKGGRPDEWIRPIIDARRGKLASSRGRLGTPMTGP